MPNPRGGAPRLVAVEITREFNGGERFTLRFTGEELEGMKLYVPNPSSPLVSAELHVRGRMQRIGPRNPPGVAPERRS